MQPPQPKEKFYHQFVSNLFRQIAYPDELDSTAAGRNVDSVAKRLDYVQRLTGSVDKV